MSPPPPPPPRDMVGITVVSTNSVGVTVGYGSEDEPLPLSPRRRQVLGEHKNGAEIVFYCSG